MRYFSRLDVYRTSNNELSITERYAFSYGWWKYWTVVDGISIFNWTRYSTSTGKHQRETASVLDYRFDIELHHTIANLTNPVAALQDELKGVDYAIKRLQDAIDNPRSRQSTNVRRRAEIEQLKQHKDKVNNILQQLTNNNAA